MNVKLTDAEHAHAVRSALKKLREAMDDARAAGLRVTVDANRYLDTDLATWERDATTAVRVMRSL